MKCNTITHDKNGKSNIKPKVSHETLNGAIIAAKKINVKPQTIYKKIAYKCPVCHKYHIGTSNKLITPKEREKWINQLKILKRKNFTLS